MTLEGKSLIGQKTVGGNAADIYAIDPSTGKKLEPTYQGGGQAEVDLACEMAWAAFDTYRETSLEERAVFLETIATEIEAIGDELIERGVAESGLPRPRIEGERGRTCGQLRLFASVVRAGEWLDVRIDPALPERQPMPRVDLRQRHVATGPVAVFGPSNFPLAFSVAGGFCLSVSRRLPRGGQGAFGSSRHIRAGRQGSTEGRETLRPAGGCLRATLRFGPRSWSGTSRRPTHQGGGLYRVASRRDRVDEDGSEPPRTDPGVC